jgi:hypothetical protein
LTALIESKLLVNKLPFKYVIFVWKNLRRRLTFLKNSKHSLENDVMLIMTLKSGLFKFPFIVRLQDLVGHHFTVDKLVGLSNYPKVPSVIW